MAASIRRFAGVLRAFAEIGRDFELGHLLFNQLLDSLEARLIFWAHQRDAFTVPIGPSCSPDSVHVVLLIRRHIIVDHQLNVVNVNASTDHIGRHKDGDLALTKGQHDLFALVLFQIRTDSIADDACFFQGSHHLRYRPLSAREDDAAFDISILEHTNQDIVLLMIKQNVSPLLDFFRRLREGQFDRHGVLQQLMGQLVNAIRHGRRKQQGLPFFLAMVGNAHDVAQKSHVQHPVRLIEDQGHEFGQIDIAQIQMGQQPARCGNDDVRPFFERLFFSRKIMP